LNVEELKPKCKKFLGIYEALRTFECIFNSSSNIEPDILNDPKDQNAFALRLNSHSDLTITKIDIAGKASDPLFKK
jgi:hypothetical protein